MIDVPLDNYEYCCRFAIELARGRKLKVLDYGCGAGQIVRMLRDRGLDAYGCDVFYEGGNYSANVPAELMGSVIRRMEGGTIPFDSESFDLVINNQVMEHVEDLDGVTREIARVLKPGGAVLSLFPDRSVWREGHCGIPFLHWFPKNSRVRVYYAAAFRMLGFGYHTRGKGVLQWSRDFARWLDQWTYYRPYDEIATVVTRNLSPPRHIEPHWFDLRAGTRFPFVTAIPDFLKSWAVRKLVGLVFVCVKPCAGARPQSLTAASGGA